MIRIRPAAERGHLNYGWLDTYHTFSFGAYRDPQHVHFRSLRVMNEDRVAPGQGFGTHPHRDMEIVTYVLEGVFEPRDLELCSRLSLWHTVHCDEQIEIQRRLEAHEHLPRQRFGRRARNRAVIGLSSAAIN